MKSIDGEVYFDSIDPPYYRGTFTELPMNPFSIILFLHLGRINKELYDKYIGIFKDTIITDSFLKKRPEDSIVKVTFVNNIMKMKPSNPIKEILDTFQEENSKNHNVYILLAEIFKLYLKIYKSGNGIIFDHDNLIYKSGIKELLNEVYLYYSKDKYYPIMKQEIDGSIRVLNKFI